jgi:hypothetical protein
MRTVEVLDPGEDNDQSSPEFSTLNKEGDESWNY